MFLNGELISVIVAVYNEEQYVGRCIESIIKQSYTNLDIVLVDDGSTDSSLKECESYAKKDSRIQVIHKENGGLVSSRKAGILAAKGEIVVYVDGDDWIEEQWIEMLYNQLKHNCADIVIAGFVKEINGATKHYVNKIAQGVYEKQDIKDRVIPKMMYTGEFFECGVYTYLWNKMFRKEIVLPSQLAVKDEIVIGEDASCVYPAILNASRIVITENAGYHYCIRPNSVVRAQTSENAVHKLRVFYEHMQGIIYESKYRESLSEQLFYFYAYLLVMMSDRLVLQHSELPGTFPYRIPGNKKKVVIYSAGAFGMHIYHQFRSETELDVVAWVDEFYSEYSKLGFEVCSLEELSNIDYDYIIIASVDKNYVQKAKIILKQSGIDMRKVLTVQEHYAEVELFVEKHLAM